MVTIIIVIKYLFLKLVNNRGITFYYCFIIILDDQEIVIVLFVDFS